MSLRLQLIREAAFVDTGVFMGTCPVVPGGGLFCVVVFVVVLIDFRERGRGTEREKH